MSLILSPGMGATRTLRAMAKMGRPQELLAMSLTELESVGLTGGSRSVCLRWRARAAAEPRSNGSRRLAQLLTYDDDSYPERLRSLRPSSGAWVRGEVKLLSQPGIAVVGTRRPSPYGAGMAQLLSRDLAGRGVVILSGMARGVDTEAHKGALEARGRTVAVWGTGIDVIYPG